MSTNPDDDQFFNIEDGEAENEEGPSYRSFAIPADAQQSTSFSDEFFDADGPPVYRSLSFMPAAPAPTMDAGLIGGGAGAQFDASGLSMAMPKFPSKQGSDSNMSDAKTTSASSSTAFDAKQNFVAPALNGLYQLERTNFRSGNSASEIVTSLHSALKNLDAVIIFKQDQLKFKCSIQTPHGAVQVHARVYSDNGEHIIEIQRRSGCSVGFCMIWRRLLADPDIEGLQTQIRAPAHGLAEPMQVEVDLQEEKNLEPLIQMVKSQYCDVQREGLAVLGRLSESNGNATLLLRSGAMTEIVRHLQSENIDCQIAATQIVANVSKANASARDAALAQSIRPIINAMGMTVTEVVAVAELQRQSCIALAALAGTFAHEIFEQGGANALSQHQQSGNAVLAREAQRAMSAINGQ